MASGVDASTMGHVLAAEEAVISVILLFACPLHEGLASHCQFEPPKFLGKFLSQFYWQGSKFFLLFIFLALTNFVSEINIWYLMLKWYRSS